MEDKKSFIEVLNSRWITPILTILSGVYGFLFFMANQKIDRQAKELEQTIKRKEYLNDLRFRIFDEVKSAITDSTKKHYQEAVKIMVEQMLTEDTVFQQQMRSIMLNSQTVDKGIKRDILNVESFNQEEEALQSETKTTIEPTVGETVTSSLPGNNLRIDIFYLESGGNVALTQANNAKKTIETAFSNRFQVRVRLLPNTINAQTGYRISASQLRFENSEFPDATLIYTLLNRNANFLKDTVSLHPTTNKTPNYISVFYTGKKIN